MLLALRACRSSLRATFTTSRTLTARYSTVNSDLNLFVDQLSGPPTAGPTGFAKKAKPLPIANPISATSGSQDLAAAPVIPIYRLHCQATKHNTIVTFTNEVGRVICQYTGGKVGFKKAQRSGYEAGYQCATMTFRKIEEVQAKTPIKLEIFLKGFGMGRESLQRALMADEGRVVRDLVHALTDRSPIRVGGTRAKKRRRL